MGHKAMLKYLLKRIFLGLINLLVFVTVLFFIINIVIPYDFSSNVAVSQNRQAYLASVAELRAQLGLDLPLWQQYLNWLGNLTHLDLGTSYYGFSVTEGFFSLVPNTLLVFLTGILFSYTLGYWLASFLDRLKNPAITRAIEVIAVTLYTSFPPWLGFLVVLLINPQGGFIAQRLYSGGAQPSNAYNTLWNNAALTPKQVMFFMVGIFIIVWVLSNYLGKILYKRTRFRVWSGVWLLLALGITYLVLTLFGYQAQTLSIVSEAGYAFITYVLLSTGETMMVLRNNIAATKGEEFIRTAKAIGLPEHEVQEKHLIRNAILPVISNAMINFPYLLTGFVMIEKATKWSGLGTAYYISLTTMDMPMILGWLVLVGIITFTLHIILDMIHAFLDPRIKEKIELREEL
jgi:peptide/nickel transport system permease protein